MTLTAADVAEIMRLVEQSTFDELTLEVDGIKLHLRRGGTPQSSSPSQAQFAADIPYTTQTQAAGGHGSGMPTHAASANQAKGPSTAPSPATRTRSASTNAAHASHAQAVASAPGGAGHAQQASNAVASSHSSAFAGASPSDPNVQDVTAPLLGTFYRAPKPGAPPFVEVGATVEEDTVVAIIEVMKLMNTVRAGVRGTVTEILARDGVLVEYGETLLRVRKS